jgi:hypothetical protein
MKKKILPVISADLLLEEDDLLRMEDKDGSLDACPNCKTDEYLMDL